MFFVLQPKAPLFPAVGDSLLCVMCCSIVLLCSKTQVVAGDIKFTATWHVCAVCPSALGVRLASLAASVTAGRACSRFLDCLVVPVPARG